MKNTFIKSISSNIPNIGEFEISLSEDKIEHLIITGKNGSGKTTFIKALNKYLAMIPDGKYKNFVQNEENYKNLIENNKGIHISEDMRRLNSKLASEAIEANKPNSQVRAKFSMDLDTDSDDYKNKIIIAFFDAKRGAEFEIPAGIQKIDYGRSTHSEKLNKKFIQFIVNLKAERSFAKDDNEQDRVNEIDLWFSRFENRLRYIFDDQTLQLKFDRSNFNFKIQTTERPSVSLTELSDGYSAVISIITEIIMRMEHQHAVNGLFEKSGVVLIDEIETHLHVDLQKKILPFLTDFFPNIQFIITTHSPFVLSSIENAVIFDMRDRTMTRDLSGYSYEALIESYFNTNKYSTILENKVLELERLVEENIEKNCYRIEEIRRELGALPSLFSAELAVKVQQIDLRILELKGK